MKPITKKYFGTLPGGKEIFIYTLTNKNGLELKVINYGGIIVSFKVPDRNGKTDNIVLGFGTLPQYLEDPPFFGAIIGRYGNRIRQGKFSLEGKAYALKKNNQENHLHGGTQGFDKVYWDIEEITVGNEPSLLLSYFSKDMEEGYPGNMQASVTYTLTHNNELKIGYKATTDQTTIVNLTQHSYFNLSGKPGTDILGHLLLLNADTFLPVDRTLIPTGEPKSVISTPFDFRKLTSIGSRIGTQDEQLLAGKGYDHCWILNRGKDGPAAFVTEPHSGRAMEVFTTEPGIQLYTGNFLDGTLAGPEGVPYKKHAGLCLETEHFPDSPNRPAFPSVVLKPGEIYSTNTMYRFLVS
jgi:aldose 1-epimerase